MRKLAAAVLVALVVVTLPATVSASTAPTATVTPDHTQFWPYVEDGRRDEVRLRYSIDDPDGVIVDDVLPVGTLTITDATQAVMRSYPIPACDGCEMEPDQDVTVAWDGTDANGILVLQGTYTVTTQQTYHYVDPVDGTTLREASLTSTAHVETFTGQLTIDEELAKKGTQTAKRRCRVLGFYGDCSRPYSTEGGALLVTTWEEAVTLTYRFRVPGAADVLGVQVKHRRGNTACRAYRVRHAVSDHRVAVTVSMGGQRLSQCWTTKLIVQVTGQRTV